MSSTKLQDQVNKSLSTILKGLQSGGSDLGSKMGSVRGEVSSMLAKAGSREMKDELSGVLETIENAQKKADEQLLEEFGEAISAFCSKNNIPLEGVKAAASKRGPGRKKKAAKTAKVAKKPAAAKKSGKRTRMNRQEMVQELKAFAQKKGKTGFTRAEIMEKWGIKGQNATNLLRVAIDSGVLKKTGSQRSTRYFLK